MHEIPESPTKVNLYIFIINSIINNFLIIRLYEIPLFSRSLYGSISDR